MSFKSSNVVPGSSKDPSVKQVVSYSDNPTCTISIQSVGASMDVRVQCDDGSDDSLVPPKIASAAVIAGIGFIQPIKPWKPYVALKKGDNAQCFTFSRVWKVPRAVLQLSSGKLVVLNISYLVADDDRSSTGLLIGRPVLKHLKIDTKRILENNREKLDGIDCSAVGNPTIPQNGGYVSMVMISRQNHVVNIRTDDIHSSVNYFHYKANDDLFPDPCLLDPIDHSHEEEVRTAVDEMIYRAKKERSYW